MFLIDNPVSRSTKSNITQNDLTSKNYTQESLHDIEDIAPSKKKTSKKCETFKNTQSQLKKQQTP